MAAHRLHLPHRLAIYFTLLTFIYTVDLSEADFDFDGIPGANHEFRMEVAAGHEECFYQRVRAGAELHVSFEVLRGADRNIDMYILDPNDQQFGEPQSWKSAGVVDKETVVEGDYKICLDNTISRFTSKLVYIYMIVYDEQDWDAYTADIAKLEMTVRNFTEKIKKVDHNVAAMKRYQAISRQHVITDWYILYGNNRYIQYMSILSCLVIIGTGAVQTFFLRRLFKSKKVTPDLKPRA